MLSEEGIRFEELIQNVEKSRSETERLRQELTALRDEAARQLGILNEEKSRLADRSRQVVQQAREEARELYADALQEIENLLDSIRSQQKERNLEESHLTGRPDPPENPRRPEQGRRRNRPGDPRCRRPGAGPGEQSG